MERSTELKLSAADRNTLEKLIAGRPAPAGHVRRARMVLLSAQGVKDKDIAGMVGLSPQYVSRIRKGFKGGGVEGMVGRKRGGRTDHAVPADTIDRVVETDLSPPPAGRARWTTRLLGRKFGLTSRTIFMFLRANALKPHLVRIYDVSRDPAFAARVRAVVGLYLDPPDDAIALSVDEKTSIEAPERTQLPLPLRQGRASRHRHEYERHGVLDLYATLNIVTGEVDHACSDSHTAADSLAFMERAARQNPRRDLHVVLVAELPGRGCLLVPRSLQASAGGNFRDTAGRFYLAFFSAVRDICL